MSFVVAYHITGGHEGGYVNDPTDRGGETYRGIARKFHPNWAGWVVIDGLKNEPGWEARLRQDERMGSLVRDFFKQTFWNRISGDELDAMSEKVAQEVYDTGVNSGTGTAAKMLQRSLNRLNRNEQSWPDIAVDGGIGPTTLKTVKECLAQRRGEERLMKCLDGEQYMHYASITDRSPEQERFFNGWLNRV